MTEPIDLTSADWSIKVNNHGNDTEHKPIEAYSKAGKHWYYLACAFFSFIALSGSFVNFYVARMITKQKNFKKSTVNWLLLNVCIADFICAFFGGGFSASSTGAGRFLFGYYGCVYEGYLVSIVGITCLMSITVLSVERYFIICKPFGKRTLNKKSTKTGLWLSWLWSFIWNTPPLFMREGYTSEGLGTTCAPNYRMKTVEGKTWLYLYFVTCFFLPLLIMIFSYGNIIVFLKRVHKNSSLGKDKPDTKTRKVTIMAGFIMLAFTLAWTPYALVAMASTFFDIYVGVAFETIAVIAAKSSTIYNPVIYILMNKKVIQSRAGKSSTMTSKGTSNRENSMSLTEHATNSKPKTNNNENSRRSAISTIDVDITSDGTSRKQIAQDDISVTETFELEFNAVTPQKYGRSLTVPELQTSQKKKKRSDSSNSNKMRLSRIHREDSIIEEVEEVDKVSPKTSDTSQVDDEIQEKNKLQSTLEVEFSAVKENLELEDENNPNCKHENEKLRGCTKKDYLKLESNDLKVPRRQSSTEVYRSIDKKGIEKESEKSLKKETNKVSDINEEYKKFDQKLETENDCMIHINDTEIDDNTAEKLNEHCKNDSEEECKNIDTDVTNKKNGKLKEPHPSVKTTISTSKV